MPRAGVTPAKIFDLAESLADAGGFEGLTLAGIAAGLGIRTPSLFKHVRNLQAIRDELAAQGIQLADGPQGTSWRRA